MNSPAFLPDPKLILPRRSFWMGVALVILLLQTLLPVPASGQTTSQGYGELTRLVERLVRRYDLEGASLLVADANGTLYRAHFGAYDDDTVIPIASASKWLSAGVILSLVDDGALSLDTPVRHYFPEANRMLKRATVRQLFSHSSGLPGGSPALGTPEDTLQDSIEVVLEMDMAGAPGRKFAYGGASMQLAGAMAEIAGGQDWADLFAARIAAPLGMTDTTYTLQSTSNPRVAGGASSSLEDYGRFMQMIFNYGTYNGKRVLSRAAVAAMEADQIGDARITGFCPRELRRADYGIYGLGVWRFSEQANGRVGIATSPGAFGFFPWVDRERGLYGVFMIETHRLFPPTYTIGQQVVEKVSEIHDGME